MAKVRGSVSKVLTFMALWPWTHNALAVGVGEIELHSHLNEPLIAEIPLLDTQGMEESDFHIQLAFPEEFQKRNLDVLPWLQSIQFNVIKKKNRHYLIMTTNDAIKDPIVDVIIQISWSQGKFVRDFTILLDPVDIAPVSKQLASKNLSVKLGTKTIALGKQYTASENLTLWRIATKLVTGTNFSVYQGVVGIVQKNPQYFKQGVHNLPNGVSLWMPTAGELSQIDPQQAQGIFDKLIKNQNVTLPTITSNTNTSANTSTNTVKPTKQLKLVEHTDTNSSTSTLVQDDAMRVRLSQVEQAIENLKRQNEDISEKNKTLQSQNESLLQSLASKDQELNELKLQKYHHAQMHVNAQPNQSIDDIKVATHAADQTTVMDLTQPNNENISYHKPDEPTLPKKPETKPVSPKVNLAQPQSHAGSDFYNKLFWVVFLFFVSAWAWFSRNYLFRLFLRIIRSVKHSNLAQNRKGIASREDKYGINFDFNAALEALVKRESPKDHPVAHKSEKQDLNETGLTLDDAEIYIAYEHYEQAKKLLTSIIHAYPENWDARLKLLEVLCTTKNYEEFDKWSKRFPERLKNERSDIWEKVEELKNVVESDRPIPSDMIKAQTAFQLENESQASMHQSAVVKHKNSQPLPEVNEDFIEQPKPKLGKLELVQELDLDADFAKAKAYIESGDIQPAKAILEQLRLNAPQQMRTQVEALLNQIQ